jgi:hypothetical protein
MREAGGRPKARPLKAVKPPEDRVSAADTELDWRRKGKKVEFLQPDELEEEEDVPRAPAKRAERRIVLDDSDEEDEPPMGFEKLRRSTELSGARVNPAPLRSALRFKEPAKEKAYKLVSKFDDGNIVQNLVNQTRNMVLDGVTVGMMTAMNGEYAKALRETTLKVRKPVKPVMMAGFAAEAPGLPFMEEDEPVRLNSDAISIDSLTPVDSVYISTEKDVGLEPGCVVAPDIVLQYYSTLAPNQAPKQIYAAVESANLRVLFPVLEGKEKLESVVDPGSEIVSMAKRVAERLGLSWDPDITIFMQSANAQLKQSAGLARNVRFTFGDIHVYLQVHIIETTAYDVLLGRPFDILTRSNIQNFSSGMQTITITDPNTQKRVSLPTLMRGKFPPDMKENQRATVEEVRDEDEVPKPARTASGAEKEADFQGSSRN